MSTLLRTLCSCLFALLVLASFSGCTTPVEVVPEPDPVGFYAIDVKTTFLNKFTATGLKNGHIAYMRMQGTKWCVDAEIGEDVSFWIVNVQSTAVGDSTVLSFDLELRSPAMFSNGELIEGRYGYRIAYPNTADLDEAGAADAAKVAAYVRAAIENNKQITKQAAASILKSTGQLQVKLVVDFLVNAFFSEAKIKRSQLEGALVGAITFIEMKNMIRENLEK
jgi:hypothetical protein